MISEDLISVEAAGTRLGVSRATMYRWLDSDERPAFFVRVCSRWKVSVPMLNEYIGV